MRSMVCACALATREVRIFFSVNRAVKSTERIVSARVYREIDRSLLLVESNDVVLAPSYSKRRHVLSSERRYRSTLIYRQRTRV